MKRCFREYCGIYCCTLLLYVFVCHFEGERFIFLVSQNMATAHVEPVFLLRRDLPFNQQTPQEKTYNALEVCLSAEKVSGRETITGAQEIRGLWRVYPIDREARTKLLLEGMTVRGHTLTVYDKNPFILSGGRESPATKVWIGDIPISVDNTDIETALVRLGCTMRSRLMMEKMRNRDGKLTRFLTGRRFVFIDVPGMPLEKSVSIGGLNATIYHREQPKKTSQPLSCGRCLKQTHRTWECDAGAIVCRVCFVSGHRQGDPECIIHEQETATTGDKTDGTQDADGIQNNDDPTHNVASRSDNLGDQDVFEWENTDTDDDTHSLPCVLVSKASKKRKPKKGLKKYVANTQTRLSFTKQVDKTDANADDTTERNKRARSKGDSPDMCESNKTARVDSG